MSQRVLLNGSYDTNLLRWSLVIGLVICGIGGLVYYTHRGQDAFENTIPFLVIGAICFCLTLISMVWQSRKRSYLELLPNGFILTDKTGSFEYQNDQVVAMGILVKDTYSNGEHSGKSREAEIVILDPDGPRRVFTMQYLKNNKPDPLGEWFEQQIFRLGKLARQDFDSGRPLLGVGWRLDRNGFILNDQDSIPVADLAAANVVDGEIRIWKQGEENYSIALPAKAMNAYLLAQLITEEAEKRPKSEVEGVGLGRLIFERNASINPIIFVLVMLLASLFTIGGIGVLVEALNNNNMRDRDNMLIMGPCFILGSLVAMMILWRMRKRYLRCYEKGIRYLRGRKVDELLYSQIASFTFSQTRQYYNGAYIGTTLDLRLIPYSDLDAPTIKYSKSIKNADQELEDLREFISSQIAHRMLERVDAGTSVEWTKGYVFHDSGLHCPSIPVGILKREAGIIGYSRLSGFDFQQGYFYLFAKAHEKSIGTISVGEANFWPGFVLLSMLMQRSKQTPYSQPEEPEASDVDFS